MYIEPVRDFRKTSAFYEVRAPESPLDRHVRNPKLWGETPLDFVNWFNHIWHEGDPSRWGPDVFTANTIMLDPVSTSTGAEAAAADFLLLFEYFPDLRGEVVTWSRNDTDIFINWRFVVTSGLECPVIDRFTFQDGFVSHRQAYFDSLTLLAYLVDNHGAGPLLNYLLDRFFREGEGLEVIFLPRILGALVKGCFTWTAIPLPPPARVTAKAAPGGVALEWDPVPGARSYTVKRSTSGKPPFSWIEASVTATSYVDTTAEPDTQYFYSITSNKKAKVVLSGGATLWDAQLSLRGQDEGGTS